MGEYIEEDNRFTIKKHVAISAGAGSGKTYTLSRRYINALLGFDLFTFAKIPSFPQSIADAQTLSARPIEIVTTTFTEAGAMEMRSRIEKLITEVLAFCDTQKIDKDLGIKDISGFTQEWIEYIRSTLKEALYTIHLAIISTIHKFALSIIKKNVELVPMDTTIDVMDDNSKQEMFEKIWFEVINSNQETYLKIDELYSVYNLKEFAKRYTFDSRIRDGFETFIKEIDEMDDLKDIYLKLFFHKNIQSIVDVFEVYEETLKRNENLDKVFPEYLKNIFKLRGEKLTSLAGVKSPSKPFTVIKNMFDSLFGFNDDVENEFKEIIQKIHSLLKQTRDKYFKQIEDEGKLDFDRILQAASELANNPKSNLRKYKYFFVDEFQDTNMFQWDLIKNSAKLDSDTSANIFLVGDEKQSIFEFQGAEVSTFSKAIEEIKTKQGENSIITPPMSLNFRSDKHIIDFVNLNFKNIMIKDKSLPDKPTFSSPILQEFIDKVYDEYLDDISNDHEVSYHPLQSASKKHGTVRVLVKETPKLHEDTIKKDEKAKLTYNSDAIALHEANMVAYFINEIKNGSYKEYNGTKKDPNIRELIKEDEKAIAILCDSKKHMLMFKDALKKYHLESKVSASEDFYSAKEIIDIFYVLAMIKYFKDDLDFKIIYSKEKDPNIDRKNSIAQQKRFFLTGALRSSILRYDDKKIYKIINENNLPDTIKDLIGLHDVLGLSELINHIIGKYEVKRVYAHFDDYPQKKANITKLLDMANRFTPVYKSALDEFVEQLESRILQSEGSSEDQAFYESTQTNAIEIRTMHSSKGLAWPMVIVPELGGGLQGKSNSLNYASFESKIDKKIKRRLDLVGFSVNKKQNISNEIAKIISEEKKYAEKKRLLYVAMTRPKNHLVLSVAKNDKGEATSNSYWARWLDSIDISKPHDKEPLNINENDYLDSKISHTKNLTDGENISFEITVENYDFTLEEDKTEVVIDTDEKTKEEKLLEVKETKIFKTEKTVSSEIKITDPFEKNKAADFGTDAHLILELGYKDNIFDTDEEKEYIEQFITKREVSEPHRLKKAVENFKSSVIYEELKNSKIVKFEQEFNFFDVEKNDLQKRIIDLLYFCNGKWNIIDFKSNSLQGRCKEDIIKEHAYDEQLEGYFDYVAKQYGKEEINRSQILWLEDGTLSDLGGAK